MTDFVFAPERADHDAAIEALHAEAFGPGRFTRAAFRLREQGPHDRRLSFVVHDGEGALLASVRMTAVIASRSGHRGHLLGPLAVAPARKKQGLGRQLVGEAVTAATDHGSQFVLLVGDAPYYGPLGFGVVPAGRVSMPGPVDPRRLLAHPLGGDGVVEALTGTIAFDATARS